MSALAAPPGLQLRRHCVNIIDPQAAAATAGFLGRRSGTLASGAAAFYAHFADEYDFLYVFSDGPIAPGASGRYTPVRRPAIAGTGSSGSYTAPGYPANVTRLRGIVAVNFGDAPGGPTLHETLHHWAVDLDPRFGFGRDRDQSYGNHWGIAGINGQQGGFDPATLRCEEPSDRAAPACRPSADGITRASMSSFAPYANGGDSIPYAPMELYLMGLLPRAEVGGPFLVLEGAHFESSDRQRRRVTYSFTGSHTVSIEDIVAVHGERLPATTEDRHLRGAFVAITATPLSDLLMLRLERWAMVFGGDAPDSQAISFARATGGRAALSTRLGAVRGGLFEVGAAPAAIRLREWGGRWRRAVRFPCD